MTQMLERMTNLFDHVLIDSPPLLLVADALELARVVDGVVVVVRRNEATSDEAREVRALLERLGIHLVGAIFTDVESGARYGYEPYPQEQRREPRRTRRETRARRERERIS
jgi:Mrp family chromosome partitioning ATPase